MAGAEVVNIWRVKVALVPLRRVLALADVICMLAVEPRTHKAMVHLEVRHGRPAVGRLSDLVWRWHLQHLDVRHDVVPQGGVKALGRLAQVVA